MSENIPVDTAAAEPVNVEADLGAVWDRLERDNGAARGEDGKFAAEGQQEASAATPEASDRQPDTDPQAEQQDPSQPQTVPVPPTLRGFDAEWSKIPADVQASLAAREAEIHNRLSEQGRQISTYKPLNDIFDRNKDLLEGKKLPDGTTPTMVHAVDFLMNAQRRLEQNPIAGLVEIADRFGVRQHLAAALAGQAPVPADRQPQALRATDVEQIIREVLNEDQESKSAAEELHRLSQDKPFISEIADDDMVHAINRARAKLGDTASREAVFSLAYDMAVNADPDLRAKAAAAKKAAAATDPRKTEEQKRAASVNVTSTSTGKARDLSEEELLGQVYDKLKS